MNRVTAALIGAFSISAACYAQDATPSPGPCASPALSSVVDRPGAGRSVSSDGAICVVPPKDVVIETGVRYQITSANARSYLVTYPDLFTHLGIAGGNEIAVDPGLVRSVRSGMITSAGAPFIPATGYQDAGIGFKHLFLDHAVVQDSLEFFTTFPTGNPVGPTGFSNGTQSYLLGFAINFNLTPRVSLSNTDNVTYQASGNAAGVQQWFTSYQPSFTLSYSLSNAVTALLSDQITFPTGPTGGTGNRGLFVLQDAVSPRFLLDVEYELNLLPTVYRNQHAFGAGISFLVGP